METIKTWQERLPEDHVASSKERAYARDAEIADLRAALSKAQAAPGGADAVSGGAGQEAGCEDWLGRALDLEAQARRVESNTVRRTMEGAAICLRLMGKRLAQRAGSAEPIGYVSKDAVAMMQNKRAMTVAVAYSAHTDAWDQPLYTTLQPLPTLTDGQIEAARLKTGERYSSANMLTTQAACELVRNALAATGAAPGSKETK